MTGAGGSCAKEDVERLNGFFRAGYALWSKEGTGGAGSLVFDLNAFRNDANDDFLVKGEELVVATEDCAECTNGAFALRDV